MLPVRNTNLEIAIRSAKLRKKQVAFLSRIQPSKLSDIISGYSRPKKDEAKRIAFVVGRNPVELFPEYQEAKG